MSSASSCPDCGEYPVNHVTQKILAIVDTGTATLFAPVDRVMRRIAPLFSGISFDRFALPFYRILAALHIGTLRTDADPRNAPRTHLLWEAARRKGIAMWQFQPLDDPSGVSFFVAEKEGRWRAFEGLPRPRTMGPSPSIGWMDNKAALKRHLVPAGIPMARGRACMTLRGALRTMHEVGAPVITKPNLGSRSRHSTVHIMTDDDLRRGFTIAQKLSPWVIVEQELQGLVFRILLIDGEPVGVVRREPPFVTGDGTHTIRELIIAENKNPKRHGGLFHEIPMDDDVAHELSRQGLSFDSVPPQGAMQILSAHASRFYGGSTTNMTAVAHPDNMALFRKIAKVLGDPLVGVDFIIGDMTKSWKEQLPCGVIECNSLPNTDLHHEVLYGDPFDASGLLFDLAFPPARRA
jgi:cyanophycin synthetase